MVARVKALSPRAAPPSANKVVIPNMLVNRPNMVVPRFAVRVHSAWRDVRRALRGARRQSAARDR
jgi:hypothetical protein